MQVSDSVIVLLIYSVALYMMGALTVLHLTSRVGLMQEIKQLLSNFARNTLGL
jgi:hypothetical protein